MAIAIDATTSHVVTDGGLDNPVTVSHTCAGSDRYMLVGVGIGSGDVALTFSSGPTYNSVSMSQIANAGPGPSSQSRMFVFELVAPATGANNLVFTMSGGGNGRSGVIIRSYTGVNQSTPTGTVVTNTGDTGTPTVTVSSATDELVTDLMAIWSNTTMTVGADQTQRVNGTYEDSTGRFCSSDQAGAGSVVMDWTGGNGFDWATVGVPLKPASASATLEQEGYRWYDDDGDEDASTALAGQDTGVTLPAGSTARIRMLLNSTGDMATKQYKLQYKLSSAGTWTDIA